MPSAASPVSQRDIARAASLSTMAARAYSRYFTLSALQ